MLGRTLFASLFAIASTSALATAYTLDPTTVQTLTPTNPFEQE